MRVTVIAAGFDRWDAGAQPAAAPDDGDGAAELAPVKDLFGERGRGPRSRATTTSTCRRSSSEARPAVVRAAGIAISFDRVAEGLAAVRDRIERAGGGPTSSCCR